MKSSIEKRNEKARRQRYNLKKRNIRKLPRLSVYRSNNNLHAQIIDDSTGKSLIAIGTESKTLNIKGYNCAGSASLGEIVGKAASEQLIKEVVFDRGSYRYHGRIKSFAEAVRKHIKL